MESSTKRLQDWLESVRKLFNMGKPATTSTGGDASSLASAPASQNEETIEPTSQRQQQRSKNPVALKAPEQAKVNRNHTTEETEHQMSLAEKMEEAKELYPGSKDWEKDEERLFEILYLRQDLPMLPSHWTVDFRGFPIPENIFETSEEYPPIIFAHSKDGTKEYSATTAITRLVDLTLSVRTLIESEKPSGPYAQKELRGKAAELIKNTLDEYLSWAARDGGYDQHKIVPNIVAEIVDAPETQEEVVQFMMGRMRALGQLQRDFYRVDRDAAFWSSAEDKILSSRHKTRRSLKKRIRAGLKRNFDAGPGTPETTFEDELAKGSPGVWSSPSVKTEPGSKKRRLLNTPALDVDDLARFDAANPVPSIETTPARDLPAKDDALVKAKREETPLNTITAPPHTPLPPHTPSPTPKLGYSRRPPVIYGLYVLGTSIFILTMDSAKGDTGYISFHVDINFSDNHQSVWNALTVALAICSARDELMTRVDDFPPITAIYDSDPDV